MYYGTSQANTTYLSCVLICSALFKFNVLLKRHNRHKRYYWLAVDNVGIFLSCRLSQNMAFIVL